jgi:hypothetical protein
MGRKRRGAEVYKYSKAIALDSALNKLPSVVRIIQMDSVVP